MTASPDEQRLYAAIRTLMKENDALKSAVAAMNEPIAIVGMACRLPGSVNSLQDYWQLLSRGGDTASAVPLTRWDHSQYYDPQRPKPGKIYTSNAHFIDDYEQFDADFFAITPKELECMDPQHRLLIELTYRAFENALLPIGQYHGSKTGVFVGHFTNDYGQLITKYAKDEEISAYTSIGNSASTLPGRISYLFGFQGPSFPINTACSSSLVAAHLACTSLRQGECDLAVAGGVNLMLSPEIMINICQAQMLADDGRCHTFDASANGYGRGEGAGVVLLKRLSDALRNGDRIETVILASGTNQDGASSALSVPNGQAQQALLHSVLQSSGLQAKDIAYLEAHGTGTSLGDPVEMNAINHVYQGSHTKEKPLYVSSVKANIGHLEAAAGVAGIIKIALMLKHKSIPPHVNLNNLNPAITLDVVPTVIPQSITALDSEPAIAISAFGFSGSNAHMIFKPAPERTSHKGILRSQYLIKLSAKSPDALQTKMSDLLDWLDNNPKQSLVDLSYSLNVGRDDYDFRSVLMVSNLAELRQGLEKNRIIPSLKKMREVHWTVVNQHLKQTEIDWFIAIPAFKQSVEVALGAIQDRLQVHISLDDFTTQPEDKLPLLYFCWHYAQACYYLYLGVKPASISTLDLAVLPMLVIANKLSMQEALDLVVAKEDDFQEQVIKCNLAVGDFPMYIGTQLLNKSLLQAIKKNEEKEFHHSADQLTIHLNDLMQSNPEVHLQTHLGLAYMQGQPIDWAHYEAGFTQEKIDLPLYPFTTKAYITPIVQRMHDQERALEKVAFFDRAYPAKPLSNLQAHEEESHLILISNDHDLEMAFRKQWGKSGSVSIFAYRQKDLGHLKKELQTFFESSSKPVITLYALALSSRSANAMEEDTLFMQQYQALVSEYAIKQQLYYLSRNANALANEKIQTDSAAIHGLIKAINFEYAGTDYKTIDFDTPNSVSDIALHTIKELTQKSNETDIMYRNNERFVARIEALNAPLTNSTIPHLQHTKSYVITGGLGGLGLVLCAHLITLGAGRVHLLSRRAPNESTQAKLKQWNQTRMSVQTHAVDVSQQHALNDCLDVIQHSDYPIAGFFHLAGSDDRAGFSEYDWPRFEKVLAAKIKGAQHLHDYSAKLQLDYFVLFSSIASTIGSARQAPYVVANAYLDALAQNRRAMGLPALSIQWGPWAEEGLINKSLLSEGTKDHLLNSAQALSAFDWILTNQLNNITVVKPEFLHFLLRFFDKAMPEFLSHCLEKTEALEETDIVKQLKTCLPDQLDVLIEDYLITGFKQVTNWEKTKPIDLDKSFFDMGIDSLMAIELAEYCRKGFAPLMTLSPTLLFDTSTVRQLTQFLKQKTLEILHPELIKTSAQDEDSYTEEDLQVMSLADIDAIIGDDDE